MNLMHSKKAKYDIFSLKNTKYLIYRFNDFQNSIGKPLIKIRHTLVTDNYLAAEEIQNQDWEYFIETVIEICRSKEIGSSIQPDEELLLSTVENETLTKKVYHMVYNVVAKNFYSTIKKISVDKEKKEIKEDLVIKIFWWKDSLTNLDSWIAFYYQYDRFPGSENFTNVPQFNTPIFLKTEPILSPPDLYQKFAGCKRVSFSSCFSSFKYSFWWESISFTNCLWWIYEKINISSSQ